MSTGVNSHKEPAREPIRNNPIDRREIVTNSGWDGSVRQVTEWLKAHLNDPSSFEPSFWSKVKKHDDGTFSVRCKYRAKNGFGALMLEDKIFLMDASGKVTGMADYSEN